MQHEDAYTDHDDLEDRCRRLIYDQSDHSDKVE